MAATNITKTKRSTDEMIEDAIDKQQSWLNRRRDFTRDFLRRFNVFKHNDDVEIVEYRVVVKTDKKDKNHSVLRDFWFPILCALIVILIAVFVMIVKVNTPVKVFVPPVPEPIIKPVSVDKSVQRLSISYPCFDIVRIEDSGRIVIAGRTMSESSISIVINKKIVATERTNLDGEFVYSPVSALKPGNYEIALIDVKNNKKSKDKVFVYISERGYKNSVSLLMTENGSKIMQAPELLDGDLVVSKIDYLSTGRMVVTGKALPRLRVSLTLNDKYLGFARVSDYKNFGLGVDVGQLKPGQEYELNVRLHDGNGNTIANIKHEFIMPKMTGDDNTFYTVRRGDCLWVIARNFLRRGVLFSIIAERNNIKNPDLIYPEQLLKIPFKK